MQLLTTGGRKKIKKEIIDVIEYLGFSLMNMNEIRSRRTFNQYRIDYNQIHANSFLKQAIVVETAFQTESYPTENVYIQSMISDFLEQKGRKDLIKQYEMEPFQIIVQSKERTLVDKVYALGDYYLSNKFEEHSRHIYDIYMLTKCIELTDEIAYMFCDIRKLRQVNKYCYSA